MTSSITEQNSTN